MYKGNIKLGFCLKPNKVYATDMTNLGLVIFQPVNGNVQLYGSNVTRYINKNGSKKIIIPEFKDLILIWDDWLQKDCVHPMNCLTSWIAFEADNPDTELWVNTGINLRLTPTFDPAEGQ